MHQRSAILNVMIGAVTKAAKGLRRDFGELGELQVSKKGTSDFVTAADLRSEKILREELSRARPKFGFLMEEGGRVEGEDPGSRWVIDPLDGTTNFIHAVPYFCISVALEQQRPDGQHEVTAAVIYDPIRDELFTAEKNGGAYLNERHRLRVSARERLDDSLLATSIPRPSYPVFAKGMEMMGAVGRSEATIRATGASALDLAWVAAGRYDGCWFVHSQRWDIAAGQLLVVESGGNILSLKDKEPASLSGAVLAGNPSICDKLAPLIRI